jgi:hypothetical protein
MFFEIDGDFSYNKQIYGANKNNSIVSRAYSAGFSNYIFSTTAIDFNFTYSKDITSNNDRYNITGYTVDHTADQSRVVTSVYGVGVKQMLAPKGAFLVPIISFGYAREFVTSDSDSTYLNTATSTSFKYTASTSKAVYNSVFGTFMLQLHFTEALSFKAAVKTLFPAFEFNKAKENLKYSVGFSWIF